jgi:DNA-binding response OmpR family regulator
MRAKRGDVGIVAISGGLSFSHTSNIDILDVAAKLGADVTLKKPFQMSELAAAVDRALAAHGTNASLAQG